MEKMYWANYPGKKKAGVATVIFGWNRLKDRKQCFVYRVLPHNDKSCSLPRWCFKYVCTY